MASEIRKILAFRTDFWVTFIGQILIQILVARALWESIFESTGSKVMAGFTLETMTLYYLIVPIGSKMLTGENLGFISREIYDGTFNRYLIYPISFFEYKTVSYLTYSAFYGLQLVLIFLAYNFLQDRLSWEIGLDLGIGVTVFMVASFAYLNLAILIELISLWADNIWSLMVMIRFFCFFFGGTYIPLTFFPEFMQEILKFTPFPYLVSLPIRSTMGVATGTEIGTGIVFLIFWAFLFRWMAKILWKKGQHHYAGVGI